MIIPYDWQKPSVEKLLSIFGSNSAAADLSDTGVGKTVIALETAKRLGLKPLIITPKSVRTAFRKVAEGMGVDVLDVVNIERLKTGKTPYLAKTGVKKFAWSMEPGNLCIWDEASNASGIHTDNARILALTRAYGIKTLMLSATLGDSPLKLRAPGYLLDLHNFESGNFYGWCRRHGCSNSIWHSGLDFVKGPTGMSHMKAIHEAMASRVVRLRISEIPEFPECSIQPELFNLDSEYTEKMNEIYAQLAEEIKAPDKNAPAIVLLMRARQKTEALKVPLLADLISGALDENKSVVCFVSFRETLRLLREDLGSRWPVVTIHGDQTGKNERDMEIAKFQNDDAVICLAMAQAGGFGISLHDVKGDRPRVALINPGYSAVHFVQNLGRIWRAGARSKALQRIVTIADTVEENVYAAIKRKLKNIQTLNDDDISGGLLA